MAAEAPKKHACEICWEEFNNDVQCTPCFHKFHVRCIKQWIQQKNETVNIPCPICKTDIRQLKYEMGLEDDETSDVGGVGGVGGTDDSMLDFTGNLVRMIVENNRNAIRQTRQMHSRQFPPQVILPVERRPRVIESNERKEVIPVEQNINMNPLLALIDSMRLIPVTVDQNIAKEIKEDKSNLSDVMKHINRPQ